jgi:hypothetical protein
MFALLAQCQADRCPHVFRPGAATLRKVRQVHFMTITTACDFLALTAPFFVMPSKLQRVYAYQQLTYCWFFVTMGVQLFH